MMMQPRSMPTGARNIVRSNDSASLWNLSLSPGWTEAEAETLRLALIKFGIGNWKQIVESGCLPGKHPAQLNLQAQRLLGQQSTGEFAGLHIDANKIYQGITISPSLIPSPRHLFQSYSQCRKTGNKTHQSPEHISRVQRYCERMAAL